jgi:REP element-mobilizing transposase RayT
VSVGLIGLGMPRMARVVIPGCPHHVTRRGNRREDMFFTEADRVRYLDLLGEYAKRHRLTIRAYCLMTNPVHLVAVPRAEASLATALKPLHMRYTQHVNWTQRLTGRLWADMTARLRHCTRTGRPTGGARFIARLEALVGRVLRPKKGGRPRKKKPNTRHRRRRNMGSVPCFRGGKQGRLRLPLDLPQR